MNGPMPRILITGGSGFIGTNLVQGMLDKEFDVLSIDEKEPQDVKHESVFKKVDILDVEALARVFAQFSPSHVVHLAARTDLNGKAIADYECNMSGVKNLVGLIRQHTCVQRCVFASTKLVASSDYAPKYDTDYSPHTLYGESKAIGEKIVRESSLQCTWCIARPSSIWGPWFGVPYRGFFLTVGKGLYFHPGKVNPPKSFGYIGNAVFQIEQLLKAPREAVHTKTFYLSDYDEYTIREWANAISLTLRGKRARTIPESIMQLAAWGGDCLQKMGYKNPPMTSFRLNNMRADTTIGVSVAATEEITGPLPYTMEQGVDHTIAWLRQKGLI